MEFGVHEPLQWRYWKWTRPQRQTKCGKGLRINRKHNDFARILILFDRFGSRFTLYELKKIFLALPPPVVDSHPNPPSGDGGRLFEKVQSISTFSVCIPKPERNGLLRPCRVGS